MPRRVLLTAGPTREHLDPVRFLSNGSSGRMGYALASAAAAKGWHVDLVSGPVSLPAPEGVTVHRVVSADEMLACCEKYFIDADLFIAVAAVADFRPVERAALKRKPGKQGFALELVPTVDILRTLAARKSPGQTVVGFAAETHEVEAYARRKLTEKKLDWIVANDVSKPGLGMDAEDNAVLLISAAGEVHALGPAPKTALAARILDLIHP